MFRDKFTQDYEARAMTARHQIHFMTASGKLSGDLVNLCRQYVDQALARVQPYLVVPPLDIIVMYDPDRAVPELGIGGMSQDTNLIFLYLDVGFEGLGDTIPEHLGRTLAHELHHCCRRAAVGYGTTLGATLVSEGLADHFVVEVFGKPVPQWSTSLGDDELNELLKEARPLFESEDFDYFEWFLGYKETYPMWAGYALGYWLVAQFLNHHPDQSAASSVTTDYHDVLL